MQQPGEVLKKVAEAVTQKAVTFDIDIYPRNRVDHLMQKMGLRLKKRSFSINPLTLNQLTKISTILLPIEFKDFNADGILKLMKDHGRACAEVVAIAVTESRQSPSGKLIDLFFFNLAKDDMTTALSIVVQQMAVINFITTIASIRSLNTLEPTTAGVKTVKETEANPQTQGSQVAPGTLSVAS